jgi:hypothetical protein
MMEGDKASVLRGVGGVLFERTCFPRPPVSAAKLAARSYDKLAFYRDITAFVYMVYGSARSQDKSAKAATECTITPYEPRSQSSSEASIGSKLRYRDHRL